MHVLVLTPTPRYILVSLVVSDAAGLDGVFGWLARLGVPVAAAFISAGFFFSSMGKG